MARAKRHKLSIQYAILSCCKGKQLLQAQICLHANLCHNDFRRFSGELVAAGLLSVRLVDGRELFSTSDLGTEFIKHYLALEKVSGGFG